ncbi:hypothetical protein RFI_01819 [Reticulomyxa filosa]|uniref:Uncharacterized protein n=1 Tax=Reticulomyxa filosa TaxID=46433 RepID=X6P9M1_RETFI|nr:hypothetical protein RFI_01819 [Reticulomyxa filosa]|eukprot:ETO35245.1 hypothetical protein RFI_01819 [Reticulomyxa filosa]
MYKILQRTYKFGSQPILTPIITEKYGGWFDKTFGRNSKDMQNAVSGAFVVPRNVAKNVYAYVVNNFCKMDLETNVIDEVNLDHLGHSNEDACTFARSHHTIGKQIIDQVRDRLRKFVLNDHADIALAFDTETNLISGKKCFIKKNMQCLFKKNFFEVINCQHIDKNINKKN